MEKSINMKSEELKIQLFNLVNNSELPFSSVYYIFKDFMQSLTESYDRIINEELQKYRDELKKAEEDQKEEENE